MIGKFAWGQAEQRRASIEVRRLGQKECGLCVSRMQFGMHAPKLQCK